MGRRFEKGKGRGSLGGRRKSKCKRECGTFRVSLRAQTRMEFGDPDPGLRGYVLGGRMGIS